MIKIHSYNIWIDHRKKTEYSRLLKDYSTNLQEKSTCKTSDIALQYDPKHEGETQKEYARRMTNQIEQTN